MRNHDTSTAAESAAAEPFSDELTVAQADIDQNGHVNNVVYIQWMQDIAVLHSATCGGTEATHRLGCTWIVRSHHIDYLSPAFEGDKILARTWVVDFRKVRSRRRYLFIRQEDGTVLARGETDWVFVDAASGRPKPIAKEVRDCYPLLPEFSW